MRYPALLLAMGLAISTLAMAAGPDLIAQPSQAAPGSYWQYQHRSLNAPDALDLLKTANPRHYRIARQVLASATQICEAQKSALLKMKFEARNLTCSGPVFTSFPAKGTLQFRIDDTVYSVLIEYRNTHPKLIPIG